MSVTGKHMCTKNREKREIFISLPMVNFLKVFDKMAYVNSVDPDQTATLFSIPLSILIN